MRTLAIVAMLVLLAFVTPSATAAPADCTSQTADATLVKATVSYGTDCADASVERCTLHSNPEYPSHPYWVCTRII